MPETEILKERSELDPNYQWDLRPMYADDAAWEADLAVLEEQIGAMAAFAGTLRDAESIGAFFDAETELGRRLANLYCYASMRRSEDTRAEAGQRMYARITAKYAQAMAALSFAEPEILALPEETLQAAVEDARLADHKFTMQNLLRRKPHTLSAAEEKLLASLGEALGAPAEIADNLQDADLVFDPALDSEGQSVEVTGANYIMLQMSLDRTLRKNAFASLYKGYRQHINTFAAAYAGTVKAAVAEAAARHYPSSRAMSMAGENVPAEVYDNLVASVHRHMPAMYRYLALRKKILGVDTLHYYDVYAPLMGEIETRYTYEQAQQMVLDAVAPLGPDYVALVQKAYAERWIDVYPNKGKSGGAYSTGTYDSNPYILTNFTGTLDSVSTLAHEMGHSMHSWHSNHHQPPQYADYTLFVAEVASTVNENLLIEQLLQKETQPQVRLYLLNQYLENFKGTVYRQTMFAEFEKITHEKAGKGEPLTAEILNDIYYKLNEQYFGDGVVIDKEIALEWSRIPHFYTPFYVYQYATGYSAAIAISRKILSGDEEAREGYMKFLSGGSSMNPIDLLRLCGVDMTTKEPVESALKLFGELLDEMETLLA